MTSEARVELSRRIADFDELMDARDTVCPSGAGRPAQRQGQAIVHAAVVLLAAAFEAYVEEIYDEAVDIVFDEAEDSDIKQLKANTSGRLNNASVFRVNQLFFNLGIPWIMKEEKIRWQKFSNQKVRKTLDEFITSRNKVAHGGNPGLRKSSATKWRGFVERLADRIELVVADAIEDWEYDRPW